MKKLILFFGLFISFIGCNEIEELSINAKDGLNGEDGKNGYSVSMYFDPIAMMKISYWDRNYNGVFDYSADTIIYRESYTDLKIIKQQSGECYDIIKIVQTTEMIVATICNGTDGTDGQDGEDGEDGTDGQNGTDGTNGEDGEDAYNFVIGSVPYPDQAGNVIGQILSFYWDIDKDGFLSDGDLLKYSLPIPNGTNGTNGADGRTPMISQEIVGDSIIFITSIDGVIMSRVAIAIPKDGTDGTDGQDGEDGTDGTDGTNGTNGQNPSLKTVVSLIGVTYIWYIDVYPYNNTYDEGIDTKLSEETIPYAKDGQIVNPFVSMTLVYDFQGAGSSYFSGTGFNSEGFYYNDGNIYALSYGGYFEFPPLIGQYDLISLNFNYGSTDPYKILVKVIDMDDVEHIVDTIQFAGNPSFDKVTYDTYSIYNYNCADLNSIEFENVKRILVEVIDSNQQSKALKCTNEDIIFDNFIMLFKKR